VRGMRLSGGPVRLSEGVISIARNKSPNRVLGWGERYADSESAGLLGRLDGGVPPASPSAVLAVSLFGV
jgi:hypothetical protein